VGEHAGALVHPDSPLVAHESFHGISGIYPFAEAGTGAVVEVIVVSQNVDCVPASSKSVPPTATLNGVDAVPLTAIPWAGFCAVAFYPADASEGSSHPADPLSPDDTETVIPSAAACCHMALISALLSNCSQRPKLTLITGAILLSMMY